MMRALFEFLKDLFPRSGHKVADVVISDKGAFPLGTVILTNPRVGVPTSKCMGFCVELRKRTPLVDLHFCSRFGSCTLLVVGSYRGSRVPIFSAQKSRSCSRLSMTTPLDNIPHPATFSAEVSGFSG
jgi:hypothetical protein